MITVEQIKPYLGKAPDRPEAEAIKKLLRTRLERERRLYLTQEDFYRIAKWKLDKQFGRVRGLLEQNSENLIEEITAMALSQSIDDPEEERAFRFRQLTILKGVDIRVASAILALSFPDKYCVIDFRCWQQVFGISKNSFTLADYKKYLKNVSDFAQKLGWPVQEVDLAIWAYDRDPKNKRKRQGS